MSRGEGGEGQREGEKQTPKESDMRLRPSTLRSRSERKADQATQAAQCLIILVYLKHLVQCVTYLLNMIQIFTQ